MISIVSWTLIPSLSILFKYAILGTPYLENNYIKVIFFVSFLFFFYLSAWFHTVIVWACTPAKASKIATAPSITLKIIQFNYYYYYYFDQFLYLTERSTSTVKSTWPGVSIRLILCWAQLNVIAAAVIVIPLSLSCFMKSITVSPLCTSVLKFQYQLFLDLEFDFLFIITIFLNVYI